MAQEPLDQHREPSKHPPPPQERQADRESRRQGEAEQLTGVVFCQEATGTSSGATGDWLRLSLSPAPRGRDGAAGSQPHLFTDRAGPLVQPQPRPEPPRGMDVPPGAFLRPAVPGIPQASITLPMPRAGPPWLPPWSQAAAFAAPPPTLPFPQRTFYTPGAGAPGIDDTIRLVLPPAAAGVWFALQAAPHQWREPFLPQIPRSYLRIKDMRVTVGLLIKYLVSKLGLGDESEVEITCRGRPLLPFLTLQHVRDSHWCQGDTVSPSVAPDTSAANYLMVLQYGRRP